MKQYIDKDIIVAELKHRIKECDNLANAAADNNLHNVLEANELLIRQYTSLLSFLNTLEVKEDNLETLLQSLPEKIYDENSYQVYEMSVYHFDGQCVVDYVGEIEHDSLCSFAGDTFYEASESAWEYLRKDSLGS